jgi:hypothetical protein
MLLDTQQEVAPTMSHAKIKEKQRMLSKYRCLKMGDNETGWRC